MESPPHGDPVSSHELARNGDQHGGGRASLVSVFITRCMELLSAPTRSEYRAEVPRNRYLVSVSAALPARFSMIVAKIFFLYPI